MSERQKIEERLRRKEAEIIGFEEKIKAARIYVQALRDVLKMMAPDEDLVDDDSSAETILRSGSAVAKARDVIQLRGEPVHVSELLEALGKEQTRENRASLTSSLSAYVRRNEIFTRPAPNTFGLIELGHMQEASESPSPPRGFGKDDALPPEDDDDAMPF